MSLAYLLPSNSPEAVAAAVAAAAAAVTMSQHANKKEPTLSQKTLKELQRMISLVCYDEIMQSTRPVGDMGLRNQIYMNYHGRVHDDVDPSSTSTTDSTLSGTQQQQEQQQQQQQSVISYMERLVQHQYPFHGIFLQDNDNTSLVLDSMTESSSSPSSNNKNSSSSNNNNNNKKKSSSSSRRLRLRQFLLRDTNKDFIVGREITFDVLRYSALRGREKKLLSKDTIWNHANDTCRYGQRMLNYANEFLSTTTTTTNKSSSSSNNNKSSYNIDDYYNYILDKMWQEDQQIKSTISSPPVSASESGGGEEKWIKPRPRTWHPIGWYAFAFFGPLAPDHLGPDRKKYIRLFQEGDFIGTGKISLLLRKDSGGGSGPPPSNNNQTLTTIEKNRPPPSSSMDQEEEEDEEEEENHRLQEHRNHQIMVALEKNQDVNDDHDNNNSNNKDPSTTSRSISSSNRKRQHVEFASSQSSSTSRKRPRSSSSTSSSNKNKNSNGLLELPGGGWNDKFQWANLALKSSEQDIMERHNRIMEMTTRLDTLCKKMNVEKDFAAMTNDEMDRNAYRDTRTKFESLEQEITQLQKGKNNEEKEEEEDGRVAAATACHRHSSNPRKMMVDRLLDVAYQHYQHELNIPFSSSKEI